MSQVDRIFKNAFRDHFTNHEGNFPPNRDVKLGDVGKMVNGYYSHIGTITDFVPKAKFEVREDDSPSTESFKSSTDISTSFFTKGSLQSADLFDGNAGLKLEFGSSKSVFFSAAGVYYDQIEDLENLGKLIIDAYKKGTWKKDYILVSKLMRCLNTTIVISGESGCKVDLMADSKFNKVDLSDIELELQVKFSSKSAYEISNKGEMVIGMGLSRIHDNLFIKPIFKGLSKSIVLTKPDSLVELDNITTENVAFQDLALPVLPVA